MNKALSVLLAAALLTALLASCGDAPPPAQETPTPLPTAAPAPAETPAPEQKAFSRGRIEGRVYESDFLSLRFTAPEGWRYASDEELAARMGLSLDIIGEDVFGDGQEMLILVTELTVNYYSAQFINRHGCDKYFAHNKSLMFYERQKELINEIEQLAETEEQL